MSNDELTAYFHALEQALTVVMCDLANCLGQFGELFGTLNWG